MSKTAMMRCLAWGFAIQVCAGFAADTLPPEHVKFFEDKIRPVLVTHCYQCHSAEAKEAKKLKGGLFLDTRAGVLTGGDTGPALVAGQPDKSLLMTALRWQDSDIEMPPKQKLPDDVIADFAKWIEMGAPDPRAGAAATSKRVIDIDKGREHWAFKPLSTAQPKNKSAWAKTTIDRYILDGHKTAGLKPSEPLSREKLVRRVYFDLTGLPPTPEEVAKFLTDRSKDAYEKLIDRLLASERYGEHWGRHWLDVVRYAESGGYEFDGYRPGAYHYRDWVIRALNADMPYDEFVRLQIAGDKLKPGDYDGACATGFLVAGPYPGQITAKTRERIRYDQLDDMLSTIGSSMVGLTFGCVRCHDHKFDPIPQIDYYSLAAALATTEHGEVNIDKDSQDNQKKLAEHEKTAATLREALKKFETTQLAGHFAKWQTTALPKLSATAPWQSLEPVAASARKAGLVVNADGSVLNATGKNAMQEVYTIKAITNQMGLSGFRIDVFTGKEFPMNGPGLSDNGNFVLGDVKIIAKPLDPKNKVKPVALKLKSVKATFEQDGYVLASALDNSPNSGWGVAPQMGKDHSAIFAIEGAAAGFEGGTELEFQLTFDHFGVGRLRLSISADEKHVAAASKSTPEPAKSDQPPPPPVPAVVLPTPELTDAVETQHLREIKHLLKRGGGKLLDADRAQMIPWLAHFDDTTAKALNAIREHERNRPRPALIAVYSTKDGGQDVYLLRRGEVDNKDAKSVPGYVQVLLKGEAVFAPEPKTDPRIALGNWLTDANAGAGHLLARVIVNRMWKYHFGKGIVATPNDFGQQGERPTHPELLDYLAGELIKGGWKLKPLHRQIMQSAVYLQGSDLSAKNRGIDPENKLWWQRPSQRVQAESIRDALLSVSGKLDTAMFGPAIDKLETPRRSVYLRVRRSELFPFMTLFDAPEPSQSIGDRGTTTLPTQALTMMNSPFAHKAAEDLRDRVMTPGTTPAQALAKAFQIALARPPTPAEGAKLYAFFEQQKLLRSRQNSKDAPPDRAALAQTCLIMLCMNEFVYVD